MAFAEFAPLFSDIDAVFVGVETYPADERYENSQDKIGIQFIIGMVDAKPKVKGKRLKLSPSMIFDGEGGPNLVVKFSREDYQQFWAKIFKSAILGSKWSIDLAMGAMQIGSGGSAGVMNSFTLLSAEPLT